MVISLSSPKIETPSWYTLTPLWTGDVNVVKEGLPHHQLSPTWQMLLLGDGSPTRHLKLLTGESIEVDVLDMSLIEDSEDYAPALIEMIPSPRIRRQVWLRTASGQRLAYAVSWWSASEVDHYLQNRSLPIWDSLSKLHTELYRDVQGVTYGNSTILQREFQQKSPFWGRHYLFWHERKPLTLIYEVFSPYLTKYLGKLTSDTL